MATNGVLPDPFSGGIELQSTYVISGKSSDAGPSASRSTAIETTRSLVNRKKPSMVTTATDDSDVSPPETPTDVPSERSAQTTPESSPRKIEPPNGHRARQPSVEPEQPDRTRERVHAKVRASEEDVSKGTAYPRISKPVELLRPSYDVVVIGSGYGGGVAASRAARAGQRVCVLERGRERWPGEYPVTSKELLAQAHVSGKFAPGWWPGTMVEGGDPTGMYHLIFGKGLSAMVCNGLGGTSLMNANVFLEADEGTMSLHSWPPEIREHPDCLKTYYKRAAEVLQPEAYPEDWPTLPKLELLRKQAEKLGMADKFRRVPLATRFQNGPNSCGVEMKPSSLTGQDLTGVNDGSKNTTLVTYLADAWNWGAEMFTECEVRHVAKAEDREGYIVYFAWHGRNRGHFSSNVRGDLMWVHAKKAVFLGAGAIGTTEILLRSKEMGLSMSDQVGKGMSGNGDMLAFGYNTNTVANSIGRPVADPYNPVGPCITGMIDNRTGHENPLDGYVIQEGAMPHALAPFLQAMLDHMPGAVEPENQTLSERTDRALARFGSKIRGPYYKDGAVEKTQVYLVMSHDSSQASLTLNDDKPVLEFIGIEGSDQVKELNEILIKATQAVGGTFVQNAFYSVMGKQAVTVHPIGGACMARDGTGRTGATNHVGQVFSGEGSETHAGLIVTDGALVPTSLGVNPLATITALAERALAAYVEREQLEINWRRNPVLDLFGEPQESPWSKVEDPLLEDPTGDQVNLSEATQLISVADASKAYGFGFTEVMSGFLHPGDGLVRDERETYELGARTAEALCESARFFLSVQSFNTDMVVNDPDHSALLTGTFICPAIRGSPFMVQRGHFNLFIQDLKAPGTRNLTYDFDMKGIDGRLLHFHGYKVVDSSVSLSFKRMWRATTTLYVTVSEVPTIAAREGVELHDQWRLGRVIAKGIMTIKPKDLFSEALSMAPTGSSRVKKAVSAAKFLTYFMRKSMPLFFTPIGKLQYPMQSYTGYVNDTPPSESYTIVASDGVRTKLHMWEPTHVPKGQGGGIKNLFMVPGASVDHQIYCLPTIPYNAVNYLTRAGYRVYISVHRIGQLVVAQNNWTTYDTRHDLRACLELIREKQGNDDKIYTIAHCMGSVALSTGILDGTVPADWILGLTVSQVFMNPIWGPLNMAKINEKFPLDAAYRAVAGGWFAVHSSPDDKFVQRVFNQLLRLYPDWREELCNSVCCHRVSMVFGRCWNHGNLNEVTHRQVDRFFGGVNMTGLRLLMKQGYEGHVMTNNFEKLTTDENIERLRGLPMMLFVGRDNAVLSPASVEKTFQVLTDRFGNGRGPGGAKVMYRHRIVPGYGHLDGWMGKNAWRDVYPFVREEVDRVVRGEDYRFVEPDDRFAKMVREGRFW